MTHAIKGTTFPADRDDLLAQAEENGADEDILALLAELPEDEEFRTVTEVMSALKQARG
jgi:hypothetical protein